MKALGTAQITWWLRTSAVLEENPVQFSLPLLDGSLFVTPAPGDSRPSSSLVGTCTQ